MTRARGLTLAPLALAVALLVLAPVASAKPRSSLAPGEALRPGEALVAGSARLKLRADGDLVLQYVPLRAGSPLAKRARPPRDGCRTRRCRFLSPRRLWHSGSGGNPDARLTMRPNGSAALVAGKRVLWSSRGRSPGATLRLGRDGNLGVYPRGGAGASSLESEMKAIWETGTETPAYVGSELGPGEVLEPNQYLQSSNGQYELDMTPQGWMALWVRGAGPCPMFVGPEDSNGIGGPRTPGSTLHMEAGGNLVIRSPEPGNPALWQMRNYDNPQTWQQPTPVPGSRLVLEADGNLAVVSPQGTVVWQTETERIRGPVLCPGESLWYGQVLGSVYAGPGSAYQASYYLQIATANRGRGSEVDIVGASHLSVTHLYRDKTGPSATGMYLQMQNSGDLQLFLEGGNGFPIWETGTELANSFATVDNFGSLLLVYPMPLPEGGTKFEIVYENPDVEEELAAGIGQAEKISMSMAPMG